MSDLGEFLGIIVGVIIGLAFFALYLFSIVWAYSDAQHRGKSGCLVAILVAFLSWPIGLIAWLVFRPNRYRH